MLSAGRLHLLLSLVGGFQWFSDWSSILPCEPLSLHSNQENNLESRQFEDAYWAKKCHNLPFRWEYPQYIMKGRAIGLDCHWALFHMLPNTLFTEIGVWSGWVVWAKAVVISTATLELAIEARLTPMLFPGLAVVPSSSSWIVKEDGVSLFWTCWLSALSNSFQLNAQGAISARPRLAQLLSVRLPGLGSMVSPAVS